MDGENEEQPSDGFSTMENPSVPAQQHPAAHGTRNHGSTKKLREGSTPAGGQSAAMRITTGTLLTIAALLVAVPAAADPTAFPAPSGWTHVDAPPSTDTQRSFDTWKQSSSVTAQTITVMRDATGKYDDALAVVRKNFSDNNIKATVDSDQTCQGKTSHVFEFATGPDGHRIVINRLIVGGDAGITAVTYSRPQSASFGGEVKSAITAFCGAAGAPATR
jgi:hypothetical protein